jgi:acyl dehydratase
MRTVHGTDGIKALVGEELGRSDYDVVTQEQVNLYADATGDHQWIHVDVERATKESPFGGPIAHGYLTLALVTYFLPRMWDVAGFSMGVNYGCEKVRFPSPLPVGAKVRCNVRVDAADEIPGGVNVTLTATIQCEGAPKPACVATVVYRYYE